MAIIPLFRVSIFVLITLFSLVVLGICVHVGFLHHWYTGAYFGSSSVLLGLCIGSLTTLSLPLFLALGHYRRGVFTSTILFEILWFFILWGVWGGVAGATIAEKAYHFPRGCTDNNHPKADQICYEITVVEAFAFSNFFCAFLYYDVILLCAIINAIFGRSIWTASAREVIAGTPGNRSVSMAQPQLGTTVQTQNDGVHSSDISPSQSYNAYPQQVYHQSFARPNSKQVLRLSLPTSPNLPRVHPQTLLPRQCNDHLQPVSQNPSIPLGTNLPYNHLPPASLQRNSYIGHFSSPNTSFATLPPQPNYSSYSVVDGSQAQLLLPGELISREQLPSPYSPQ